MVVHKMHSPFRLTESAPERLRPGLLVPHAQEMARRVEDIQIINGPTARGEQAEIVAINGPGSLPTETYLIELRGGNFREVQTGLNRELGKPGSVFDSREPLFRNGKEKFAIANDASGRIMHLGIVDSERNHSDVLLLPTTERNRASSISAERSQV